MSQFHVIAGATGERERLEVRRIGFADVVDALRLGLEDFRAKPSHYVFLCLIYPFIGLILMRWTSGNDAVQLAFPLMSGFALVGPFAAVPLYEVSRRRELGMNASWRQALKVRHSPALPAIAAVGAFLLAVFLCWLFAAQAVYTAIHGDMRPASLTAFIGEVLTTDRGWRLILIGNAVGFCFAALVLMTTVVAFPLLIDRDVGAFAAIETSVKAVAANPAPMALWGIVVVVGLVAGALPLFAGLAVTLPILGHATWHLYRKTVV